MVEDKISMALKDIAKFKEDLRGIKKDMKAEEKDYEDELKKDDFYNKLREAKVKKEEQLAHAKKALFDAVGTLPVKPIQMKMESEMGPLNIQIQPEMKIYVNGKEEKMKI